MSVYPPPSRYPSIFNPSLFGSNSPSGTLTNARADATYAKLAGNQTIVGPETFSGGIKTNSIVATSTTNKVDVTNSTTATSGIVTPLRILTPNTSSSGTTQLLVGTADEDAKSMFIEYVPNGFTSADSYINLGLVGYSPYLTLRNGRVGVNNTSPNYTFQVNGTGYFLSTLTCNTDLTIKKNVNQGSVTTFASSFGTAATSHTITSTELSWLANSGWNGELKLFADDGATATNGAISVVYLHKPGGTLSVVQGSRSSSTTITTTAASNTSLTVALSASCRLCWIFTGAT